MDPKRSQTWSPLEKEMRNAYKEFLVIQGPGQTTLELLH